MSLRKSKMSDAKLEPILEALPLSLPIEMKIMLISNDYKTLNDFPAQFDIKSWDELRDDCEFSNAQRNRVKNAIFPPRNEVNNMDLLYRFVPLTFCRFNFNYRS